MATLDAPTAAVLGQLQISTNNAPAVTPALLAYLRGLGMDLSTAEDVRAQRVANLGSQTAESVATAQRNYGLSRQSATADLVNRGVLQSGEASTRYGHLAEDEQQRLADIYTARTQGTQTAEQTYSQTKDQLRRAALEQLMGAEQSQAIQKATSDANVAATQAAQAANDRYYQQMTALASSAAKAAARPTTINVTAAAPAAAAAPKVGP